MPSLIPLRLALLALTLGLASAAHGQSSCSSDGQPRPTALLERFINADCANCWADSATARARRGEIALDWIAPGTRGDDAPLSVAATRDALGRLQALGQSLPPARMDNTSSLRGMQNNVLRVAHGLPVSGYVGASIEFKSPARTANAQPWTAWLALVEAIPVGTEGSPVARNLVRNVFQSRWNADQKLSKKERLSFSDARSMDIPQGMNTERLRIIGWVQDAEGRIIGAAQSRCARP
ncbi:MAG TPA: hypothetical protein VE934_11605 [Polaromonas sp.]|uniref:hypothetical protein n=1 Tax=Polaromonas sp. TaxID=1869339 RepID=UPI002D59F840|nr:hypothetical protein [Polaromonas sp.]HYW57600.1 hypothetical protein [Polaromonas sp.]